VTVEKVQIFDIPTSAGCLELGTESFPAHIRRHGLVDRLTECGVEVMDLGEVSLPDLPRHNTPPIRNYPSPRVVWQNTDFFIANRLRAKNGLTLGLGGDCSIVVGTVSGLQRVLGKNIHLLYFDGDMDAMAPDPEKCAGSAGMGLWLLTQESEFWDGNRLSPSQVTVIGNKQSPGADFGIPYFTLARIREQGIQAAIAEALASIPKEAHILVHFDVDVLSEAEMPAAYSPRPEGLSMTETEALLSAVFMDRRVSYFEITEFMPQRDPQGQYVGALIEAIVRVLSLVRTTYAHGKLKTPPAQAIAP
jgi:arginase family enzyme